MARIRTIKPEFPQSESMGNVSRDARLLFVMLWPICDDHGRARASSRMLASLLYPYDDGLEGRQKTTGVEVGAWLAELEREGCVILYTVGGTQYLQIRNWLKHQKIDKPSKPQFPEPSESPRESSRAFAEPSPLEGKGREGKGEKEGSAPQAAPEDFRTQVFRAWKSLPDGGGGAYLAKLIREYGEEAALNAADQTMQAERADPKGFAKALLRGAAKAESDLDDLLAGAI